jgi:hypothetical protein
MLKIKRNKNELSRSRIYRRLFVLCLALFALYLLFDAAWDAHSDHLTHPLRMTPDDRVCSSRHNDHNPKIIALFQRVPIPAIDGPFFHFIGKIRTILAALIKNSRSCPPIFSDLSPPVI